MKQRNRTQAIDELRAKLLNFVDDDHSMCQVAGQKGIFCGGFAQWKSNELKERYEMIAKSRPGITRKELEDLANRWQLARQYVSGTRLACDTEAVEHRTCKGWDEFTDQQLVGFYAELCGEQIEIVPAEEKSAT